MKYEIPEWVFVWSWAHWARQPRWLIPFPQEREHVDGEIMSDEEYANLRKEWIAAGSPKKNPLEVLRLRSINESPTPRRGDLDRLVRVLEETK